MAEEKLLLFLFHIVVLLFPTLTSGTNDPIVVSRVKVCRPLNANPNPPVDSYSNSSSSQSSLPASSASTAASLPFNPIGINYHGGPILFQGINLYIIWYGSWSSTEKSIIKGFINSMSPSNSLKPGTVASWWGISKEYFNGRGKTVQREIQFVGETTDKYSQGKKGISTDGFVTVVEKAVKGKRLRDDTEGIYLVLTGKDVQPDGFCSSYCGYHSYYSLKSKHYKFGVVGHAGRCLSSCSVSSPNGSPGVDGTISVIAHELSEIATDPLLNAWYDAGGNECCDKCAWTFGTTKKASNGQRYNVIGARDRKYLLQMNWSPRKGSCVLHP